MEQATQQIGNPAGRARAIERDRLANELADEIALDVELRLTQWIVRDNVADRVALTQDRAEVETAAIEAINAWL